VVASRLGCANETLRLKTHGPDPRHRLGRNQPGWRWTRRDAQFTRGAHGHGGPGQHVKPLLTVRRHPLIRNGGKGGVVCTLRT
jgi:hypothetical protein